MPTLDEVRQALEQLAERPDQPGRSAQAVYRGAVAELVDRARPRRRVAVALAAVAVVLVAAIVGAAALLRSESDEVVATGGAPSLSNGTWVRVPYDEPQGPGDAVTQVAAVTATDDGFVAVGRASAGFPDPGRVAVWRSSDGWDWERVENQEAFTAEGFVAVMDVVARGNQLVAVGHEQPRPSVGDAAVWVSDDGVSWSRVPNEGDLVGGAREKVIWDVMAVSDGFVAVGAEGSDAAVWTSQDGISWAQQSVDTFDDVPGVQVMYAIAEGDGVLVAVGLDRASDNRLAVWTSIDGERWTRADLTALDTLTNDGLSEVVWTGSRFVAVGVLTDTSALEFDASVWTSVDGLTWEHATDDQPAFEGPGSQGVRTVDVVGDELVATGSSVWTSTDGLEWERAAQSTDDALASGEAFIGGIASAEDVVVAVGTTDLEAGPDAIQAASPAFWRLSRGE